MVSFQGSSIKSGSSCNKFTPNCGFGDFGIVKRQMDGEEKSKQQQAFPWCPLCCALSRTEYFERFTCHFQDCHISLPKFPCLLGKKLSMLLAKGTIPLPLGDKKF